MTETAATLHARCLALFQAGLAAADPQTAVGQCLLVEDDRLKIRLAPESERCRGGEWQKIHLIGFGKAACAMASAARAAIPRHKLAEPGIVVSTYENTVAVAGCEVLAAGHPLPDQNGLRAARRIVERIRAVPAGDLILLLISGGGSALLPYPVDGVSLADKVAATQLLLACGADIGQINCVRKHLSGLKGGGLVRLAAPADLHALILSDVLGDDLSSIASGPSVADDSSFADAIAVFQQKAVWDKVPGPVKDYLEQGAAGLRPETLKSGDPLLKSTSHSLIGGNAVSLAAVERAAKSLGLPTRVYSHNLRGEARQAAEQWVLDSKTVLDPARKQTSAMLAGGETTVTLTGSGSGGRNQEMALAFALAAERHGLSGRWCFLSAGTDGRDGPTDAAGGIVDGDSLARMRRAGLDPQAALNNNDSYTALKAADALLISGATGTNVADLQILLMYPY
ncbi:DUF4147 domain-containing protein [Methylomonas sp. SURF-2]|uniref:DUF4147 domain-containing protein n=1 Tax=Methylomonas subterranea TaxID=2952225 RepID=A0ABT1TFD3_9GAMM|nr:DUF4147 domain-containing protein [Methylomonas sp. SURF-2]MCQ8103968.1 DUF4147 domain-containing protein [Methylomonas sp. SURF-2]